MSLPASPLCRVVPVLLLTVPFAARAQTSVVIDEGSFVISRNGAVVGRESFRIMRSAGPGGQVLLASGQSAIGDNRMVTRLGTDSLGVPVSYEADMSVRGDRVQHLQGRGRPGRFSVLAQTKGGESARDYLLSNGALLIDRDVFHQYYFVAQLLSAHTRVITIVPSAGRQENMAIADRGEENVTVAGHTASARHYALVSPTATLDLWVDATGKLLKVSIPERGLIAVRDDLPR